jgi:hypothetical protein
MRRDVAAVLARRPGVAAGHSAMRSLLAALVRRSGLHQLLPDLSTRGYGASWTAAQIMTP